MFIYWLAILILWGLIHPEGFDNIHGLHWMMTLMWFLQDIYDAYIKVPKKGKTP